ncbi:MAG: FAD-binding and (Fe-S)-binding domain-containing protein [Terriglobales bacterium]
MSHRIGDPALAARLRQALRGEVLFDPFTRGRYSTDASIYQIEPIGVALPHDTADVEAAIGIAREEGIPVLPRGAGSSQNGQTVNEALVLDTTRCLNQVLELDTERGTAVVQPGIVLDHLNAKLKPTGWHFAVDPSTSNCATIGGMTGNNSAGTRSIQYGIMVHNVLEIETVLADGSRVLFGEIPEPFNGTPARVAEIARSLRALYSNYAADIAAHVPKVLRKVGGYNLHMMGGERLNLAKILVGSEGTLGFFTRIKLQLHRIPKHRVQAICRFQRFHDSMDMVRRIVTLNPSAVELIDRAMLDLASPIATFRSIIDRIAQGDPDALLFVEFSGEEQAPLLESIDRLEQLLGDHGFSNSVVRAADAATQAETGAMRKAGFAIMMSMKGDGKPVSFMEDCAVPLEDLAEYTDRLRNLFARHATDGIMYAHASVGCLHIRPVLSMKDPADIRKMRQIAEEAFAIVRDYKGSHSGEHGDGISRSEFHNVMFGERLVRAFETVKDTFDPAGMFNPGRIVRAPRFDDRSLFRFKPDYAALPIEPALDWTEWGGLLGAAEMCNNNGTCRKVDGVMCPSYMATRDEKDVTRGRANTLRLALSGQLGPDALFADAMKDTMDLCVSCKACRRECPTGVDMARMKIEFLQQWHERKGVSLRSKLTAYLPRYAPVVSRFAPLMNLRNSIPGLAGMTEKFTGLSARRKLPAWRSDVYRRGTVAQVRAENRKQGGEVLLFVDCFSRYFEPENARAARAVLEAAGYDVIEPDAGRPLCCGRTFLSAGLVDPAREELARVVATLGPFAERGTPIIGIEPSCLLTFRDELKALLKGKAVDAIGGQSLLIEEFLAQVNAQGKLNLAFRDDGPNTAFLHGHCHQKAFGAMPAVVSALRLVPNLEVRTIDSSCCGMAGAFGYEKEHYEVSMKMAERSLLPAVRKAPANALIVADGTSCRHQIEAGARRPAIHVARVLESALIV